ncbi:MAG: hypothetical protein ACI4L1_02555 [Christensenellales bacterium]
MKKINKGFVFYLLLLLGILFAGFVVCVCILIFSPGTSIFGLKYYKVENEKLFDKAQIYSVSGDTYEKIDGDGTFFKNLEIENLIINSNVHSVNVLSANSGMTNYTEFHVTMKNECAGFTTDEIISSIMRCNYYTDTKTLEIVAKVPQGFWNITNSCSINIALPFDKYSSSSATKFNLKINAGSGDVTIGDTKTDSNLEPKSLYLKSLNVTTSNTVRVTEFGYVGTSSSKGVCEIDAKSLSCATTMYATDLNIKTTGSVTFSAENSIVATGNVKIESENATSKYGNVNASNLYLKNIYGSQTFNNVTGNVLIDNSSKKCDYAFKGITGKISAGEKAYGGFDEIVVENCNITVEGDLIERDVHTSGKFVFGNQNVSYSESLEVDSTKTVPIYGIDYTFSKDEDLEKKTITYTIFGDGEKIEYTVVKNEEYEKLKDKTTKFSGNIKGVKFEISILEDETTWQISADGTRK